MTFYIAYAHRKEAKPADIFAHIDDYRKAIKIAKAARVDDDDTQIFVKIEDKFYRTYPITLDGLSPRIAVCLTPETVGGAETID